MTTPWTVERVQRELPAVTVDLGAAGQCTARCAGRDRYCGLVQTWLPYHGTDIYLELEFPWSAIAQALNAGRPLAWETRPRKEQACQK